MLHRSWESVTNDWPVSSKHAIKICSKSERQCAADHGNNKVHVRRNRLFKLAGVSQAHTRKAENYSRKASLVGGSDGPRCRWAYARLSGNSMMNLIDDDLEV